MCGGRTRPGPRTRARLSRGGLRRALTGLVCQHLTGVEVVAMDGFTGFKTADARGAET